MSARFSQVVEEYLRTKRNPRGWLTRVAGELGVSRMQIGRDFKSLLASDRVLSDIAFMLDAIRIISKPIPGLK